MLTMSICN